MVPMNRQNAALGGPEDAAVLPLLAVEAAPGFAANLAAAGRLDAALAELASAGPDGTAAPARCNALGLLHFAAGRHAQAVAAFAAAVLGDPASAVARYNLGAALEALGHADAAASEYRGAIALDPLRAEAHVRLGNLLHAAGREGEATACFGRAATAAPDSPLGLLCRAQTLIEEGMAVAAEDCLRQAVAAAPQSAEPRRLLGVLLKSCGRFAEAVACFEAAIACEADHSASYAGLLAARRLGEADRPLLERMRRLLAAEIADQDRINLHFALAKACEDLGEAAQAMAHLDRGNGLEAARLRRAGRSFDGPALAREVDGIIAAATPDCFARHAALGAPDETPLLVLGMMRSGTTLVERILAGHPAIGAAGELAFWGEAARELAAEGPAALTAERAARFAAAYRAVLGRAAPGARLVVDKMPANFLQLGLIRLIFPKARIIHCRRDPVDTALSIYATQFAVRHPFAYDRADIVAYYRQYRRLMAHWRRILPADRFIEVDYEELIAAPEATARRLVAFCGLDWRAECLAPEPAGRMIRTASAWQARQPIYRSSLARWRRYEPWLGALADLHRDAERA